MGNKNRIIFKWGCGGQREDLPQNENGKGEIVKREIDGEKRQICRNKVFELARGGMGSSTQVEIWLWTIAAGII